MVKDEVSTLPILENIYLERIDIKELI